MTVPATVTIRPVAGMPEVRPGDDLAALVAVHAPDLADGDVVVVSSKIVSKAEGRHVHGQTRQDVVQAETDRVVAGRGEMQIVQTRHGFVMAAAGVDASNVEPGSLLLLPVDPDESARALRRGIAERLGIRVGVVVTDTFGRPWRLGQTDVAIGAAGVLILDDHLGRFDVHGNELAVTAPAYADELAAAADLVKGKVAQVPVAVVRGLPALVTPDDGPGVRALVRPADEDLFRLGTREAQREAVTVPRGSRRIADAPVDLGTVRRVLDAAYPPGAQTWRLAEVEDAVARKPLLDAVDLPTYVPHVVVPYLTPARAAAESEAERTETLLAIGGYRDRLLLACAVEGLGAAWAPAGPVLLAAALDLLGPDAEPVGLLAIGAAQKAR